MKKLTYKKVLAILLATLLAFSICYAVGVWLGYTKFTFSWTLNLTLMAWYTYVISNIDLSLNSSYFKSQPFEKNGRIYVYAGVHVYRKLLVWIGWEKLNKKKSPINKNLSALMLCESNTRISELGHTLIALIVFIVAIVVSDSWQDARWLLILNVLLNIYPVLVQRYNRPRYTRVLVNMVREKAMLQ